MTNVPVQSHCRTYIRPLYLNQGPVHVHEPPHAEAESNRRGSNAFLAIPKLTFHQRIADLDREQVGADVSESLARGIGRTKRMRARSFLHAGPGFGGCRAFRKTPGRVDHTDRAGPRQPRCAVVEAALGSMRTAEAGLWRAKVESVFGDALRGK